MGESRPRMLQMATRRYLVGILAHRYVLCPPGEGKDTFRVWEALALGSVPMVAQSSLVSSGLYAGLPVVVLPSSTPHEFVSAVLRFLATPSLRGARHGRLCRSTAEIA